MNLKLMLADTVRRYGRKTGIILGDRRLSYAQLDKASNKIANALIKMGMRKGDRGVMLLPNSPEFVIIYFGIVKAGGIAVPLDTRYKVGELAFLFGDCQPTVLVAESPFLEPLIPLLPQFSYIEHVISLNSRYEGQFLSYPEIMATASPTTVNMELDPEDIATILYTSGPTLHPRGVVVSHHHLLMQATIAGDGFRQSDNDVAMLFALPLHHAFGLIMVLLASIAKGSTLVIVPGTGLSIASLMVAIEKEKGTIFLGVPYIFALAVSLAKKDGIKNDLSSLRLCGSGGAPLPTNVIRRFKHHYGLTIIDFWGLTEAVALVTCPPVDGTGKLGSVGKALPGWEVKIVDDRGKQLPPNQLGEIIVAGPIMNGYYNNPQATAETIKDGWLHTGDIGCVDEHGYLFLSGRKKEIIIVKGQNIYPSDIEEVLSTHPKIAEARVIGIPDKLRGEIVGAVIRLKKRTVTTAQEIRHFCLERLTNYKVPKQIIFLESLPKTAAGKISWEDLKAYLSTLPRRPFPFIRKPR